MLLADLLPPPLYTCKGCGRRDLTIEEMGKDRSKPSGVHSRCLDCKRKKRGPRAAPKPPVPPDPVIAQRRAAVLELISRHRLEFEDIMWSNRHRPGPGERKKKAWVSLGGKSF